jgi:nucleoside phosphorylase
VLGVVTGLKSEAHLLRGLDAMCVSTGGRAHVARAKIERLVDRGVRGLVSFGIAGALSPELKTGDLVIADKVVGEGGEVWPAHQAWIDAVLWSAAQPRRRLDDVPRHAAARRSEGHSNAAPLWTGGNGELTPECHPDLEPGAMGTSSRTGGRMGPGSRRFAAVRDDIGGSVGVGAILGLDRLLSSPQGKADAFARTGALAVDMESHHVARAAAARGLPFIAIRAISDRADQALPAIMASFVDQEGRTRMSAVLAALILGRVSVGELLAAGRASRRAHHSLLRCRGALAGLG